MINDVISTYISTFVKTWDLLTYKHDAFINSLEVISCLGVGFNFKQQHSLDLVSIFKGKHSWNISEKFISSANSYNRILFPCPSWGKFQLITRCNCWITILPPLRQSFWCSQVIITSRLQNSFRWKCQISATSKIHIKQPFKAATKLDQTTLIINETPVKHGNFEKMRDNT